MKHSKFYHLFPTLPKFRRQLRRACQKIGTPMCATRSYITLRDDQGRSIYKSRRWRNRIIIEIIKPKN